MQWLSRFRLVPVLLVSAQLLACGPGENKENPSTELKSETEASETVSAPRVFIEVFPVFLSGGEPFVLVPGGKESWQFPMLGSGPAHDLVRNRLISNSVEPEIIHSTSWRQDDQKLIITYLVVIRDPAKTPEGFETFPVVQSGIVRGGATSPPRNIPTQAVINHAFQHLAWLLQTDPVVHETLVENWEVILKPFQAQPARAFEN